MRKLIYDGTSCTSCSTCDDVIDGAATQLQQSIPVAMQALGGLLALAGIGHKIDKSVLDE